MCVSAYVTRVIHYEITLDKPIKPLRIGMASDLHLGKLFGGKELDKLVDIMQQEKGRYHFTAWRYYG